MRSCEIHGTALFGHKIGGNVMNLGLNLSAVSFWQLAQRRTCKQMGRHATDTVTLEITTFAGGGSLERAVGRSVGRSSGRPGFLSLLSLAPEFCNFAPISSKRGPIVFSVKDLSASGFEHANPGHMV